MQYYIEFADKNYKISYFHLLASVGRVFPPVIEFRSRRALYGVGPAVEWLVASAAQNADWISGEIFTVRMQCLSQQHCITERSLDEELSSES